MKKLKDNPLAMFLILVLAVTAGQFAMKFGAGFLPDHGVLGALKVVFGGAGMSA